MRAREARVLTIVDYGMGNVGSIVNMLKKIGVEATTGATPGAIEAASALILPGVGAFDAGMRALMARRLDEALDRRVTRDGVPLLGLCLGMQLCARGSEEGTTKGFGWIDGDSVRFRFPDGAPALKVPHMGWNTVKVCRHHALTSTIALDARFYFAHSYYLRCSDSADVLATASYGVEFPAIVAHRNVTGLQCHPEKSHRFGMDLLRSFAAAVAA